MQYSSESRATQRTEAVVHVNKDHRHQGETERTLSHNGTERGRRRLKNRNAIKTQKSMLQPLANFRNQNYAKVHIFDRYVGFSLIKKKTEISREVQGIHPRPRGGRSNSFKQYSGINSDGSCEEFTLPSFTAFPFCAELTRRETKTPSL